MRRGLFVWAILLLGAGRADAWKKQVAKVAMRDGVGLQTVIWRPDDTRPLPILLLRTPDDLPTPEAPAYSALVKDGYIFAFQHVRGAGGSEGRFVFCRPPRQGPNGVDEATDTNDTITWLLANAQPNNGRVGMLGGGYAGWAQLASLTTPHPALRAISPESPIVDPWKGDVFFHQGAFRLAPVVEWLVRLEGRAAHVELPVDVLDRFEWYLEIGSLTALDSLFFKTRLPGWTDVLRHPSYDWYWEERSLLRRLGKSTVPALVVGGWWDDQTFAGTLAAWEALAKDDANKVHHLVIGPWRHRGAASDEGRFLGPMDFGQATSAWFREKVQAPFFAFHLKDRTPLELPRVAVFQTGANVWEELAEWPPQKDVAARPVYLRAYGRLSFLPPEKDGAKEADSYLSDPLRPVPHAPRPLGPTWEPIGEIGGWQLADQRFADSRPDVLSYVSPRLDDDVTVSGRITARLWAATTGTDADWVVKVIDVWPEDGGPLAGRQMLISSEILRARYTGNQMNPSPVKANAVVPYELALPARDHRFLKGHRIMVQVQSSWFPLFDRNPQKFVEIFEAGEGDFQKATHNVMRSKAQPSQVVLPIVRK